MVRKVEHADFEMAAGHADFVGEFGAGGLDRELQWRMAAEAGPFPNRFNRHVHKAESYMSRV